MPDLTTQVLVEIRDEIRSTRAELGGQLTQTNQRLERLERRQTEGEIRVATLLTQVAGDLREVKEDLRGARVTSAVVADHEQRIRKLEGR